MWGTESHDRLYEKKFFSCSTADCFSISKAQTHSVVFETTQNERLEYLFSDNPRIEHQDTKIVVTTNSTTVEFNTVDIAKVGISDTDTSIGSHENIAKKVSLSNEHIRLMNFTPGSDVTLCNMEGKQIQRQMVQNDGSLVISLNPLPSGVYVVKTKYQSFKFTRK